MSSTSLNFLSRNLTKKICQPYFDRLDNTYTGFARSTVVIRYGSSVVGQMTTARRFEALRAISHIFSKAWLVSLKDLPMMIMGSYSSLQPPLQCLGGFSPLNKVRQCEKCRWMMRRTRYALGYHPRGKFPQQAFLEIEGYFETRLHEKVQSNRSTRFRANLENRSLLPGRTTPPGIMWFRLIHREKKFNWIKEILAYDLFDSMISSMRMTTVSMKFGNIESIKILFEPSKPLCLVKPLNCTSQNNTIT